MNHSFVSIDRIFAKFSRDVTTDFNELDIIEWAGEALEFIGTNKLYEEAVAFIEIKDHQAVLPKRLHAIIQVARNNKWSCTPECSPAAIIAAGMEEECKATVGVNNFKPCVCPSNDAVWLDCNGQPIVAYDLAYYRPYFDLQLEYYGWRNTRYYRQNYSPVRLANNSFFNSLVCAEKDQSIYQNCRDEYTIIRNSIIRCSFREGGIAVAYLRSMVDKDTGYPMIPDSISHTTAIVKYITYKQADRDFQNGRQGAEGRLAKAEADWHWYCKQAGNSDMMPYGIDEHQDLLDQRSYLLPRSNSYYGFFGNLGQAENRFWNKL